MNDRTARYRCDSALSEHLQFAWIDFVWPAAASVAAGVAAELYLMGPGRDLPSWSKLLIRGGAWVGTPIAAHVFVPKKAEWDKARHVLQIAEQLGISEGWSGVIEKTVHFTHAQELVRQIKLFGLRPDAPWDVYEAVRAEKIEQVGPDRHEQDAEALIDYIALVTADSDITDAYQAGILPANEPFGQPRLSFGT